mmetsp:Transcript_18956/g.26757  ORF Transcript_18956/g.26757 Transcript_18956/m.26757 type:complete len:357 (+) Transcript_18956:154-1224(+)
MILNLPKLGVCTWVIIVLSFKTSTTTAFSAIDLNARRNYDNAIFVNPSSSTPMKNEWFITPETTTTTATRRRRRRRKQTTLLRMSKESSSVSSMPKFTQVISDVDDTLKSSGGVNVAGVALGGIDVQYERGDFYPGVAQFMLELSLQNSHGEQVVTPPKVAILTARAEEFKLALELKDSSKLAVAFRTAGERAGIQSWGLGPVLYGSVAEWVIQDRKGLRKFNNFERLLEQDPTGSILQYVYVGDTGELDQEAGETMLREYPELVKAVFLHVVSDEPNPPIPAPKVINGRPILFFRTYVGAATMATELGLMSGEALTRVIKSAEAKLKDVPRTTDKWVDLEKDIAKAIRTLNIQLV